jgi:hypothetical protein
MMEWFDKYPFTNIDCVYDKPNISDAPTYFSNTEEGAPAPSVFKEWALSSRFT